MAEILIDMTGKGGLVDNFAGDTDQITTTPNLRLNAKEGQMAEGLFNPYFRNGYMAPTISNYRTVTKDVTPDTLFSSSEIDLVNGFTFFGENGRYIYIGDNSSDITINQQIDIGSGNTLNDLDIYEIDSERKLFYSYIKNEQLFEASLDYRGDWTTIVARVDPFSGSALAKVAEVQMTASFSGTETSEEFTIPAGSNMQAIIFLAVSSAEGTTVSIDGGAATMVDSWERNFNSFKFTYYVFTKSVTAGVKDVDVTHASGSGFTSMQCVVYSGANATPVSVTDYRYSDSYDLVSKITTSEGSKYLQFLFADNSSWDVANITVGSTYNPGAQTGNNGNSVAFSKDGTKMYVDGVPAAATIIYQYTLSSAWDVTTATYAALSKDIDAQINDTVQGMTFSSDGTKLVMCGSAVGSAIKQWVLSTPWDISTATYSSGYDYTVSRPELDGVFGCTISQDGLQLYVTGYSNTITDGNWIYQFTLGTAWNPSTATYTNKYLIPEAANYITLGDNDSFISFIDTDDERVYQYNFNPLYPLDITKIEIAMTTSQQIVQLPSNVHGIAYPFSGSKIFGRSNSNDDVLTYNIALQSTPTISAPREPILESVSSRGHIMTLEYPHRNTVEVGTADLVADMANASVIGGDNTWLTGTKEVYITTNSDYNFMRKADNGFLYLFSQNKVAKIDGGLTGGTTGLVTKNVLLFPEYFTITDAVDYRSQFYIAVHHYPVTTSTTTLSTHVGKCGIIVWNRLSTQLGGIDFIELPGVREIKKIYASPDGVLKLITISDSGLVQLRQFGYNDSGGVVFSVAKEMGIGAYPQFPDGLSTAGDKVLWLANDGKLYCEKEGAVTQLFEAKVNGTSSAGVAQNITSGAILYGAGNETASTGLRSNKQGIVLNYLDSTPISRKIYPFDVRDGNNSTQTQHIGNVFTGVTYVPVTSVVRQVRIYNFPIASTGTDIVATVKLYFNQSSTVGMTKTITKDEAKRGYVDFHINKPYINGLQIEVEWDTSILLGTDTYLPSVAVVSHEPTTTKSPDNG